MQILSAVNNMVGAYYQGEYSPHHSAACGLAPVAECGVARYICMKLCAALRKDSPSMLADCTASFILRLNLSTVPFTLGHSGVTQ